MARCGLPLRFDWRHVSILPMLEFHKYQGLGNDFVIVDGSAEGTGMSPVRAKEICDRNQGVGADGVLIWLPEDNADGRMVVWNADGTKSDMCGNGLRCMARYLYDTQRVSTDASELVLWAGEKSYRCTRLAADTFRVAMGRPSFEHVDLPSHSASGVSLNLRAGGNEFSCFPVHFGNPHAVLFCADPHAQAQKYGELLSHHQLFPNRVNVNFCKVGTQRADLVVYERGVGITMACGSGACATATALVLAGHRQRNQDIHMTLPGGLLEIKLDDHDEVTMQGEAHLSFTGQSSMV
jgi:diaminopimelate epimerase